MVFVVCEDWMERIVFDEKIFAGKSIIRGIRLSLF